MNHEIPGSPDSSVVGISNLESFAFRRKAPSDARSMALARAEEMGHHVPQRLKNRCA